MHILKIVFVIDSEKNISDKKSYLYFGKEFVTLVSWI